MGRKSSDKPEIVCPFCKQNGKPKLVPLRFGIDVHYFAVCEACNFRTPLCANRQGAIDLWKSVRIRMKPTVRKAKKGWACHKTTAHYFDTGCTMSLCGFVRLYVKGVVRSRTAKMPCCKLCIDSMIAKGI